MESKVLFRGVYTALLGVIRSLGWYEPQATLVVLTQRTVHAQLALSYLSAHSKH